MAGRLLLAISCLTALSLVTGTAVAEPRIYNGYDAHTKDHPWMVHLEVRFPLANGAESLLGCGGTLVSADKIVTAAHCVFKPVVGVERIPLDKTKVIIGRDNVTDSSRDFLVPKDLWVHPAYVKPEAGNDIAVLTLAQSVKDVEPLPLAGPGDSALYETGAKATVLGWGRVNDDKPFSSSLSHLQGADITLISEEDCASQWYLSAASREKIVCAGGKKLDGADACMGDSGGPLFAGGKLIGVVSAGEPCNRSRRSGLYTKVSHYYCLLQRQIGGARAERGCR